MSYHLTAARFAAVLLLFALWGCAGGSGAASPPGAPGDAAPGQAAAGEETAPGNATVDAARDAAPGQAAAADGAAHEDAAALHPDRVFAFFAPESVAVEEEDDHRDWERVLTLRHLDPALGYTLRFQDQEGHTAEVHVYPATPDGEALDEEGLSEAITREFVQGLRDIHTMAPQYQYEVEEPDDAWRATMSVGDPPVELQAQSVRFVREGETAAASHLLVAGMGRAVVKVRHSHPQEEEDGMGRMIGLLGAFLEELEPEGVAAGEPAAGAGAGAGRGARAGAGEAGPVAGMVNYPTLDERAVSLPDDLPDAFDIRFPQQLHGGFRLQGSGGDLGSEDGAVAVYTYQPANVELRVIVRPRANEDGSTGQVTEDRWEAEFERWEAELGGALREQGWEETIPLRVEEGVEMATWYGPTLARQAMRGLVQGEGQGERLETYLTGFAVEGRLVLVSVVSPAREEESRLGQLVQGFSEEIARNLLVGGPPPDR